MKYYKIISNNHKTITGDQYPYRIGLNTLKHVGEEFDSRPLFGRGGLYFTTIENILSFVDYGDTLCDLVVPENSPIVQVEDKYKSDKIIIENMLPLWSPSTFEFLVRRGADIHACDDSALLKASEKGELSVVKFLVECGADIHTCDDYAFQLASANGHLSVVEFLASRGANIDANNDIALRWASRGGHLSVVKFLVDRRANIHADCDFALRWASRGGHLSVVEFLVERGAYIHARSDHALELASKHNRLSVVKFLVERGSDNKNALMWARKNGHQSVVDYLEEHYLTINTF